MREDNPRADEVKAAWLDCSDDVLIEAMALRERLEILGPAAYDLCDCCGHALRQARRALRL